MLLAVTVGEHLGGMVSGTCQQWGLVLLQMSRLQKNVDDLQHALLKSLHDRQPTVIYAGQNKSG